MDQAPVKENLFGTAASVIQNQSWLVWLTKLVSWLNNNVPTIAATSSAATVTAQDVSAALVNAAAKPSAANPYVTAATTVTAIPLGVEPGTFTKVVVNGEGLVTEGLSADDTYLKLDGSNANQTVNVGNNWFQTNYGNYTPQLVRGVNNDRLLVYAANDMQHGAGMEFYSTGIGFNQGNFNVITHSGSGAGTGNFLLLNTPDGYSFSTIMHVDSTGRMGLKLYGPTANLQIGASDGTEHTAPIKLNAGTLLAVPEAGALEYDGTHLYFTTDDGTRHTIL